jgi:hypothetical protein
MDLLILDKHKALFKDDQAFQAFARLLEEATAGDAMPLVICDDNLVGALVSQREAGDRLRERIIKRLVKNPASLDVLKARLESDDIVE